MDKKKLQQLAKEKYGKNKHFQDHKMPTSRRDFIKLGLIAGSGMLLPPFIPYANAETAKNAKIPFMTFDLAGGASLPGNFLVGMQGGPEDLAKDYVGNGWDPRLSGALDHTYGLPMSALESGILRGLKETLPPSLQLATQTSFKMASHLHFSLDDQSTNKTSALTYISKAGLKGSVFSGGLSTESSISGGNSRGLLEDSAYKPKSVRSITDVLDLTSFGEGFGSLTNPSQSKLFGFLSKQKNPELQKHYDQLEGFGKKHMQGDPRNDAFCNQVFGLDSREELIEAAISHNVIKNYTGPGVITIGDCDYHDGSRDNGDRKDREIGRKIGNAIHLAYLNNTPLFFQIITDGGMSAPSFERNWQSDTPLRSMSIMGYFHPTKTVELRKQQIGAVVENSETNITADISSSADKAALSALVNYLYLNDDLESLDSVFGRLSESEIDELLVFG